MTIMCADNWKEHFLTLDYCSNGERIPYDVNVNKAQLAFHSSKAQYKSMFGGSGLGKSQAAAREAEKYILVNDVLTVWIVAPTYDLAEKEFRYIHEDMVITSGFKDVCVRNTTRSGDLYMKFPWGPEVIGKSEGDPASLLGEAVHVLILSEAPQLKKETWERYLRRAVARGEGFVIANATPKGYNWCYDTFYLPYINGNPHYWSGIYDVLENPFYSRDEYERAREDLPPEFFQEQFQGKFVQFSGLVYPEFDYKWHLFPLQISELSKEFPLTCLIDPHPSLPTAVAWWLTDREECSIMGDELWMNGLVSDVCESIYEKSKQHKRKPMLFVIDADDKEDIRSGVNFLGEYRAELTKRFGSSTIVKHPGRRAKVNENAQVMKVKEKFKGNFVYPLVRSTVEAKKKPWITIADHCKQFRYELEHCCWDKNRTVENKNNHFLDLMKYYFAQSINYSNRDNRMKIYNYKTNKYREAGGRREYGMSATQ